LNYSRGKLFAIQVLRTSADQFFVSIRNISADSRRFKVIHPGEFYQSGVGPQSPIPGSMAAPIGFRPRRITAVAAILPPLFVVLITTAAMTAAVKRIKAAASRDDKTQGTEDHDPDNSLEHAHSLLLGRKCPAWMLNAKTVWALTGSGRMMVKMG
jgi:hypothetical protein